MMALGLPLPILRQGQFWKQAFTWETLKTIYFFFLKNYCRLRPEKMVDANN